MTEHHIHVHVHIPLDEVIVRLQRIETNMAKSAEVQAMQDAVSTALDDIVNDINTLLGRSTGLSDEDKQALADITAKAQQVAAIFDSSNTGGV